MGHDGTVEKSALLPVEVLLEGLIQASLAQDGLGRRAQIAPSLLKVVLGDYSQIDVRAFVEGTQAVSCTLCGLSDSPIAPDPMQ